jgi:hypothetical protein
VTHLGLDLFDYKQALRHRDSQTRKVAALALNLLLTGFRN